MEIYRVIFKPKKLPVIVELTKGDMIATEYSESNNN
jgi:hypothetical protein